MLNHVESASSAASVGAAISHSPMMNGTGLAVGGGVTISALADANVDAANQAGYWFTHASIGIFTPQQICTIIGTVWVLMCATNMIYQLIKNLKSKPRKPKKPQETTLQDGTYAPPIIQGGSGGGHPPIKS